MIHLEVRGQGSTSYLAQIIARLDNPRQGLELLGALLEDYEQEVFDTQGFGRWADNDPATRRLKNSGRVLIDSGALLRQLTTAQIGRDTVWVDDGRQYYARMQGDRNPTPPPSRAHRANWAQALLSYVVDGTTP